MQEIVLPGGRPRTVLGCLVARRGPVRSAGLGAGRLPGASWGGGFPWCGLCCRSGPGSRRGWPCRLLRGGLVPVRASPGPVAEPAPPGHQRCRVVPGRLRMAIPQRGEPVLGPPAGGAGGVGDDHRQARVGGHPHQPAAELPGVTPPGAPGCGRAARLPRIRRLADRPGGSVPRTVELPLQSPGDLLSPAIKVSTAHLSTRRPDSPGQAVTGEIGNEVALRVPPRSPRS